MQARFASPSATHLNTSTKYVLYRRDGRLVARTARGIDYLGRVYTRDEIDRANMIGADVTFYVAPPAVKVGGIPTWLAVLLGIAGAIGIGYAASRR